MKKIELHLHLDGSIRPSTISELLQINIEEAKNLMIVSNNNSTLKEYLEKFDIPLKVLQTKENLTRVAKELVEDLLKDNVIYAEIRFAPNKHTKNNLSLDEVITAVLTGLKSNLLKTNLILCMMREDSFEDNLKVINIAKKYLNKGVVAIDLAGNEALYPINNYEKLFAIAKQEHIPYTIHAGEADGPTSIKNAIKMHPKRIGHGIRAIEDLDTINLIKNENITLEICPKSNLDTNIFSKLEDMPIKKLYDLGLNITINTDNRTVSNINLTETYKILKNTFKFNDKDFLKMNTTAILNSFLSENEKKELLNKLLE